MKIQYHGPIDAVAVADLEGREVARGEVIDVPDELGARLLEQPVNWRRPRTKGVPAVAEAVAGANP